MNRQEFPLTRELLEVCLGEFSPDDVEHVRDRSAEVGWCRLVATYLEEFGIETGQAFGEVVRRFELKNAVLRGELERIWRELYEHCELLLMKGEAFNSLFFDGKGLRDYGDIDLLVRKGAVEGASESLRELGYEPLPEEPDWVRNKAYPHSHPETGITVDLHWSPVYPHIPYRSTVELFEQAREIQLSDGFRARTLGPSDTFLHICYHFFLHVGFLRGLFDVALFVDSNGDEVDPDRVREVARELGTVNVVAWPMGILASALEGSSDARGRLEPWVQAFAEAIERPRVRAMATLWAGRLPGCLRRTTPIRPRNVLGAKATGLLKGTRMLWNVASKALLDRPEDAIPAMLYPVFLGPSTLAKLEGRETPALRDYVHTAARPIVLAWKQIRELAE